jgi:malate dehydrogenase (oxaloacetate-decarboxylating)(NADP+)
MSDQLTQSALRYHREPRPGKIEVIATKPLSTQRDLSLAYSPGVAAACEAIAADPAEAAALTAKANLVAVVTNGTAVLGLGAIGPLAAKPVMEGKGVLFKKFAGIDVFDIEVDATEIDHFVSVVAALEPTFGGINLEDIKAPECFEIERRLRERMNIPVLHDDQHGTAIIVAAAVRNALALAGKDIGSVKLVTSGAGAAALACVGLLVEIGLPRENVILTDVDGVVRKGRKPALGPHLAAYAQDTKMRTLGEVIEGADIFLGLSVGGVLKPDMVKRMAKDPLVLALANPVPEILPDEAMAARADAIVATGRSDYPNQVNNVLCFPFIFRGALDVGATEINHEMKVACIEALADLARQEEAEQTAKAYGGKAGGFGRDHLIPAPFDPRLISALAPRVAEAAMKSGVATRPIEDIEAYSDRLEAFVFQSGLLMQPIFARARRQLMRVTFAEGEDPRVLRAVQAALDDRVCTPILIGRPGVVSRQIEKLGLRFKPGRDCELVDPEDDPRYRDYWSLYHELAQRHGVTPDEARMRVRTNTTVIAALMIMRGESDALICGTVGRYGEHLVHVREIIGLADDIDEFAALSVAVVPKGAFFMIDTHVNPEPNADMLANLTCRAAAEVERFGITPKVALLSHSNFGGADTPSARKMQDALKLIRERAPDLEVEGEMHADAALDPALRAEIFPNSRLEGQANLLVLPNLDAANISLTLATSLGGGITVGPILIGSARPAYILTPAVTARGVFNMTGFAAVRAQEDAGVEMQQS